MYEITTQLNWVQKKDELPKLGNKCLVYSEKYHDKTMQFRIMDSQFVRIASDISLWAYLEKPALIKKRNKQ